MDENPANGIKDQAAIDDLLGEAKSSRKLKKGIITVALIFFAWVATWVLTKSPLFGWIPTVIILTVVRAIYWDKPKKIRASRPGSR